MTMTLCAALKEGGVRLTGFLTLCSATVIASIFVAAERDAILIRATTIVNIHDHKTQKMRLRITNNIVNVECKSNALWRRLCSDPIFSSRSSITPS